MNSTHQQITITLATGMTCLLALMLPGMAAEPDPSDPVVGRDHWAFRPLSQPVTNLATPEWARTRIDDFIWEGLQSAGLQPAPDAEPRTLLRRLYIQLTGLPPTPEQANAFLDKAQAGALEEVIDRLLSSPRFGERWGRHWLDLARYADSNGLDENFLFREAWRYRNWVINAVNRDLPFNRFVLEQIAGDLLPFTSIDERDRQRIAAGFLLIGPKVLLGNDPENQRLEVADEQIDTIGRAVLGLTVGCARCHDHKFEPIPTADYYALAGIFTSTEVMEQRYMLGEQRVMERLVGLGAEGDDVDAEYERYWRELSKTKESLQHAKSALEFLNKEDAKGLETFLSQHADALAKEAKDATLPREKRLASQEAKVAELEMLISQPPKIPPRAMIPSDVDDPADESIRISGEFDRPAAIVPRGFLQVVSTGTTEIGTNKSGRLELGRWLTDTGHGAGNLTARVLANRVWHHLIGQGLVKTVDNFGRTGEEPSHPALLDHLAGELIDSGWSIKALVRKIVSSRTFAISSAHDTAAHEIDPDNRLLWRAHRRRLDPESLRDAMLVAARQLDQAWVDSTVWYLGDQATAVGKNENRRRTDFDCRSVYLPVIRNDLPELFEVFDFADPHATTGSRSRTTAATQGLFLLNDTMVTNAAEAMARRLAARDEDPGSRIDTMFTWALGGPPSDAEKDAFYHFIQSAEQRLAEEGDPEPALRAWTMASHAVFSTSRFQFLE